ncbi:DUF4453 domain-containing protein [Halovulum sp. GXIMD14793]
MIFRLLTGISLLLSAAAAQANTLCDDLWLSRNAVFDEAGFCFRSPLGRALFDAQGCSDQPPAFSAAQQDTISQISAQEAAAACDIDVNRLSLEISDVAWRLQLDHQPIALPAGQICHGFVGAEQPLRAAPASEATANLGTVKPGARLQLSHQPVEGWHYVTVATDKSVVAGGWMIVDQVVCEARAALTWGGNSRP